MNQSPLHRNAMRLTLHGPFRLFRPGFRARLREHYPTLLAAVALFFAAVFTLALT